MHEAMLYEALSGKAVKCKLCAHGCVIADGKVGFCACRANENGKLYSLNYGKSTGLALDPIEKKPFYHFKPGTTALSFGTPGCNFRCKGCQNWFMSQSPRDSKKAFGFPDTPPRKIAEASAQADGIAYTYTEPTVFFEYARDTILETKRLYPEKYHVFVSNGFFTEDMWKIVAKEKLLDAIRIDLKSFSDKFYREYCGGRLEPVLENIKRVKKSGVHLELITLVVPGENDSAEELRQLSEWVANLNKNIPLHFIRFFPQYKESETGETPLAKLKEAQKIARDAGLNYVYVGNVSDEDNTVCAKCGATVIRRRGLMLAENRLKAGKCPECRARVPGVW